MPVTFRFETNTPEMAEMLYEISERVMRPEAAKAMNRTMTFIRREASSQAARETGVSVGTLRRRIKAIKNRRSSARNLNATGFIGEVPVVVSRATPKPKGYARGGVKYKTLPGESQNPSAFFGVMPEGKKSAFARKGPSRLPIQEESMNVGPYLRSAVNSVLGESAGREFNGIFYENMRKRLEREVVRRGLVK